MDMCVRVRRGLVVAGLLLGVALFGVASLLRHLPRVRKPSSAPPRSSSRATAASKPTPSARISKSRPGERHRRRQDRLRPEGALRLGPVPGHPHLPVGRPTCRHGGRSAGHRSARLRGQLPSIKDEQLQQEIQSKAARYAVARRWCRPTSTRIIEVYHRNGRFDVQVVPKIIERPNNRVDLIFEIKEGEKTGVKSIIFVGNHAYSDYRLKEVIKTVHLELPELSADHRRLRSRPHRSRPRSDPALLSQARLCRRPGRLRHRRIRSGDQGLRHHVHDRGRRALSLRYGRGSVQHPRRRFAVATASAAHAPGRHLQRRCGREDGRGRHRRDHQARLPLRHGAAARRPQPAGRIRSASSLSSTRACAPISSASTFAAIREPATM